MKIINEDSRALGEAKLPRRVDRVVASVLGIVCFLYASVEKVFCLAASAQGFKAYCTALGLSIFSVLRVELLICCPAFTILEGFSLFP